MPAPPPLPKPGSRMMKLVNALTRANVGVYRLSKGRILGKHMGAPILLLDHVGRRSGVRRTTPLIYARDGQDYVIVGSRAGSPANPAWLYNLEAQPRTAVQVRGERLTVMARRASSAEAERLWPELIRVYPNYALYRQRTEREIPIVLLHPA